MTAVKLRAKISLLINLKVPAMRVPSVLLTSRYLTIWQVHQWILRRDPEILRQTKFAPLAIDDSLLKVLVYTRRSDPSTLRFSDLPDYNLVGSPAAEGLLQLLAALESGRAKVTGRLLWNGNPRGLPAHYWPHMTLTNRFQFGTTGEKQTCAWLQTNWGGGRYWSDLLFEAASVLAVWPGTDEKSPEQPEEGSAFDEHRNCRLRINDPKKPRSAPDALIQKTIGKVYDAADRTGRKPPNIREIVKPVKKELDAAGYEASGRHIQELAGANVYRSRRRKPGATVSSEKRRPKQ